jgi:hypothetical protein
MPGTLAMPLVAPLKYDLLLARTCSFLVNVGSDMGDQFVEWRKSHPLAPPTDFTKAWIPTDKCAITSGHHSVNDYKIDDLTYGTITEEATPRIEPFAFSAVYKTNPTVAFLVFRGTKTGEDLLVDADHPQVNYRLRFGEPVGSVDKGFFDLFKSMELSLERVLNTLFMKVPSRRLVITGHSLGSALATLTVPLAVRLAGGVEGKVQHYNQASPRVGDPSFAAFFNSLDAPTYRLVNIEDVVPTLPGPESKTEGKVYYYQHVGSQASFSAQYLSVPKNHDPCCSYSYALYNPEAPFNPIPGDCFPSG